MGILTPMNKVNFSWATRSQRYEYSFFGDRLSYTYGYIIYSNNYYYSGLSFYDISWDGRKILKKITRKKRWSF